MAGTTKKKTTPRKRPSDKQAIKHRVAANKAYDLVELATKHQRFAVVVFYVDDEARVQQRHQLGNFLYGDMPASWRMLKEAFSEKIRERELGQTQLRPPPPPKRTISLDHQDG